MRYNEMHPAIRYSIDCPLAELDADGRTLQRVRVEVEYDRTFKGDRVADSRRFLLAPRKGYHRYSETVEDDVYGRSVVWNLVDRESLPAGQTEAYP